MWRVTQLDLNQRFLFSPRLWRTKRITEKDLNRLPKREQESLCRRIRKWNEESRKEGMRNLETSTNELEERVVSLQKQINLFLALLCSLTFLFSLTLINFLWIFIPSYLGTELPPFLETFYEYASWGITPWFGALTAACFVYNRFFFEYAFNPFIVHNCVFFDCQSPVVRRIVQRMFLYLMFPTFIYAIFDIMYVLMLGIFFVSLALSLWYFGSLLIYFIFGSFLLYLVVMIGESRFVLSNSGYFTLLYRAVVM